MGKVTSIFDLDEFKPLKSRWDARQKEIRRVRGYYDGSVYKQLNPAEGFFGPRLYKGVQAVFTPLPRAVDIDCGIVHGDWALCEDAQWAEKPRKQVFNWSHWSTEGVLMIHYGASTGVSVLKVIDDRQNNKVYIQPVDPAQVLIVGGMYDQTPSLALTVLRQSDGNGEYEYAEVITPDKIRTYRDGEPFGYEGRREEYKNALGFVPYAEAGYIRVSNHDVLPGVPTFHNSLVMMDRANELASLMLSAVRKNIFPQWLLKGVAPTELEHNGDSAWFIPENGDAEALTPKVDIPGTLSFLQELSGQVTSSLPELAYDDLRRQSQIASATLTIQLGELMAKVARIRPNMDALLTDALRMAGRAAASMGLTDIAPLQGLEDGAIDPNRPILPLDPETALRLESLELALEQQKRSMDGGEGSYQQNPPARNKREKKAPKSDEQEPGNSEQKNQSEE